MTSNPIGLHLEGQGLGGAQYAATLNHVSAAQYTTVTVMNNFQLCRDIKTALPSCVVVHRDSNFEPTPGPNAVQSLVNLLNGIASQDKRIVVMVNCEAGFDLERVNMWASMIATASKMGWSLCVGNTSCGSIKCGQGNDANDWLTTGAPLLKALMEHPNSYYGCHNYSGPFLWLVSNGGWGDPHHMPDKIDWTKPQWHLGREAQGIKAACKLLGYEKLLERQFMIITEGLFDQMNDTANNPDNPYHTIKSNRWRDLVPIWSEWYPGVDAQDVLANQYEWAWEKIYAPLGFVIGIHAFTYLDAGGQWQGDRVDNAPIYLKRMEKYRSLAAPLPVATQEHPIIQPPVTPVPAPPPPPIVVDPHPIPPPIPTMPPVDELPPVVVEKPAPYKMTFTTQLMLTASQAKLLQSAGINLEQIVAA